MTVRYDDALASLIRVARHDGVDLASDDTIVLRDAAGRLAIAFRSNRHAPEFQAELRNALGPYALGRVDGIPDMPFLGIPARSVV